MSKIDFTRICFEYQIFYSKCVSIKFLNKYIEKGLGTFLSSYFRMTKNDKKVPKSSITYCCNVCDYMSCRLSQYDRHISTAKHERMTNGMTANDKKVQEVSTTDIETKPTIDSRNICICGKEYKFRQGLHKHKKTCDKICKNTSIPNNMLEFIVNIVKTNEDIKQLMVEQMKQQIETQKQQMDYNKETQKQLLEIAKEPRNTNSNNNNTQNNHFNLQFFLNETCKDAINVSEFIENIKIDFCDIENVGNKGYVSGITDMIVKNLNDLGMTKRPFHCTDTKRETIYIKDNDIWDKDNDTKEKFQKVLNQIYDKNWNTLRNWSKANPGIRILDSRENKLYHKIIEQTDCMRGQDKLPLSNEKIIKRLSETIKIDKSP